jgi:hypothetical protein
MPDGWTHNTRVPGVGVVGDPAGVAGAWPPPSGHHIHGRGRSGAFAKTSAGVWRDAPWPGWSRGGVCHLPPWLRSRRTIAGLKRLGRDRDVERRLIFRQRRLLVRPALEFA